MLTETQSKEFEEIVKPVIKWLNENSHPHTMLLITTISAELLEGKKGFQTDEFLKD